MRNFKNGMIILGLITSILLVVTTAALPIILSIALGNWLWMFLYLVMWTPVWMEILILGVVWNIIIEVFD